jgi:hypothetical protein
VGWEGFGCYSCGAAFNGPNLAYYFGEWLSPEEIQRRIDDEHSAQNTEDEEEHYPEMAYINYTQNDDDELNDFPVIGSTGPDLPPHDDTQQQSAGALTQPPEVATGLPAAEASSSTGERSRSWARRQAGGDRSRSRGSDDGDGRG